MKGIRRRDLLKMALAAPIVAAGARLEAQGAWPSRPVQIIMGFGAGGGADSMARVVFQRVAEILGQPMLIENRTGGNSVVAAQAVLQLPADGHAFFLNGLQHVVNPLLVKDLPFDYKTAFVPVTKLCNYPQTFAVKKDAPWATMQELIAYAKQNPGKIRYGTSGVGGIPYMLGQLLQLRGGIKMVNIPYKGGPEVARDVAAGQIDLSILTTSTIRPMLDAGKVRVLAVGNEKRADMLPDVPTMAEIGLPEVNLSDWSGLFAPAGVPDAIIQKMQSAVAEACRDPEVLERIKVQGTELVGDTPAEFAAFVDQQRKMVTNLVAEANISLE